MTYRLNLLALVLAGSLWAMVLVIGGAWVASSPPDAWGGVGPAVRLAGLSAIAAGQFVFLVAVADRLCPGANRTVVASVELIAGAAFALGLLGTIAALAAGASS